MTKAWVALLMCGHTVGGKTYDPPRPEDYVHCTQCESGVLVNDVVTDEPQTGPDGKR